MLLKMFILIKTSHTCLIEWANASHSLVNSLLCYNYTCVSNWPCLNWVARTIYVTLHSFKIEPKVPHPRVLLRFCKRPTWPPPLLRYLVSWFCKFRKSVDATRDSVFSPPRILCNFRMMIQLKSYVMWLVYRLL